MVAFPHNITSRWLLKIHNPYRTIVVIAAAISIHLTLGTIYTFGNMNPYITSYLREKEVFPTATPTKVNWIFVLQASTQSLSLAIGGWIEKKLGPGYTALLGGAIMSTGVFITKWAVSISFPLTLLTYGFLFGLGLGFAYNACIVCLMKWLPNNKGLAAGLVLVGFGIGAFIFNPVQTKFINPDNLSQNCEKNDNGQYQYFCQEGLLGKVPDVFLIMGASYFVIQFIGFLFLVDPPKIEEMEELMRSEEVEEEPFIRPKEALKSPTLYILWLTFFCNAMSIFFISALYKTFGKNHIHNDLFLSLVGSMASVFNAVGRVFWGFIGDRYSYQVAMSSLCACLTALMLTLNWTPLGGEAAFMIWVCAIFFCFSGTFSLLPMATAQCFGAKYVGIIYGFVVTALAGGTVLSAVLSELLLKTIGYSNMFFLCAGFSSFGFLLTSIIQLTRHGRGVPKKNEVVEVRDIDDETSNSFDQI